MNAWLVVFCAALAALSSLLFSTLTYALRDFSRAVLEQQLARRGRAAYLDLTVTHASDLIFVTAVGRLFSNILVLIGVLLLFHRSSLGIGWQYFFAVLVTGAVTLFCSVAIPHAAARHAGEVFIALLIRVLHGFRAVLLPAVKVMHLTDALVARATAAGRSDEQTQENIEEQIEQEILSVVHEGEKEGVVGEEERRMIESVIAFHDTQVGQIMTARPEIFGLEVGGAFETIKQRFAESGHSRIPVYEGSLDHVIGVLYARDLIKLLGQPAETFNVRAVMRPAYFVPHTKPLRDLLRDFRLQKVHIAIVLDEYGGTAGLVTIEDIFEELVGDISDEHEPIEPAMFARIDDNTADVDARIYIDELNRLMGLALPDDQGYDTLGGYVSTTLGRIPERGETFEGHGARFTVLDAEPQKVNRVKVELLPEPAITAPPQPNAAAS